MALARSPEEAWQNLRAHAGHPTFVVVLLGLTAPCMLARLSGAMGPGLLLGPALAVVFVAAATVFDGAGDPARHEGTQR